MPAVSTVMETILASIIRAKAEAMQISYTIAGGITFNEHVYTRRHYAIG